MTLQPVGGDPRAVLAELRRWWHQVEQREPLVVRSSGSTAAPRGVRLSRAALSASATATERRLGGPAAWVLALPVGSVGGLQVLVRSLLARTEPVLLNDHDGDWAAALHAAGAAAGPDRCCTALVPTQLHRIDRAGRLGALAGFDQVLLGGAATDAALLDRARAAGVRVVTTYGLTETCGGCVYDGDPLDGVAVRVAVDGRIHLTGPVLFDGYVDDPAATATALVDGWLRTSDLGRIGDDGRLQVLGRTDDVVVSGGVNVPLGALEQALRDHPAVAEAAAVGVPDGEWGLRVVAVVRAEADADPPTLAALRDHVAVELPRAWAPQGLTVVDRLPRLPGGKVDRLAVRRLAADRAT